MPKTRSGKILRGTINKIADNEPWTMPVTVEDPKVLDEIKDAMKRRRLGALTSMSGNAHNRLRFTMRVMSF